MKSRGIFLYLALVILMLSGCGSDNEVDSPVTPVTPIRPINAGPTNLLSTFDPSFEQVRIINRGNTNIRFLENANFRVTGSTSRSLQLDISDFASHEGKKSLRLLNAEKQTIIIPSTSRRERSPLNLVSGGRYRFSAFVRFPRNARRRRPYGKIGLRLKNDDTRSGELFRTFQAGPKGSDNWYEISAEFEIPSLANNGKLVIQVDGSDDLLIDNLSFIKIR